MGEGDVSRAESLSGLEVAALACRGCELHLNAAHLVMGAGHPHAQVVVVG